MTTCHINSSPLPATRDITPLFREPAPQMRALFAVCSQCTRIPLFERVSTAVLPQFRRQLMKRHNYGVNKCYNSTFFFSHDSFFFFFFLFTPNISSSILLQPSTTPQLPSSPHQTHLPSFSFSSAFSSPSIPIPLLHLLTLLPPFLMCLLLAVHISSALRIS